MKKTIILLTLLLTLPVYGVNFTTSQGQLMDWTLLDDTGSSTMTLETAAFDSGEGYDDALVSILHIDMAQCNTSAAVGAGASILIKSGTTDEDWHELVRFSTSGGTANAGDVNDTTSSGQAVIELALTTNFETPGDIYFLHDAGTMADSCLVQNQGVYADDDWITVIDNLVNAYDASDYLYDIVDQWPVILPSSCVAAKVLFYNPDADSNYACRVKYSSADEIE